MSVRQQSLMRQVFGHKEGDDDTCSTDTSRWSTPSRLCCGSEGPQDSSDCEDKADSTVDRTLDAMPSVQWQGSKQPGRKKGILDKKSQEAHKQKTNYPANRPIVKLPPIKPLQASKPRVQSADLDCTRELKSQVWELQQQLSEARTENKLLKRVQHRHMVALQHFQDSEGSISQILTKHDNEARVLRGLLCDTRTCRDNLARQLQATENKLLNTKDTLQHLQLLSHDQSLLERKELTLRLAKATTELEEKDKRIMDMGKNLEVCQASFNRQIVAEREKMNEATKIFSYLREQKYQLTIKLQDRERKLEKHNIYFHRFLKGQSNKGQENKMVQTDKEVLLPPAASLLDIQYSEPEERLEQQESSVTWCCYNPVQESLVTESPDSEMSSNVTAEENHQEDTETHADASEENSCSEESPEHQNEGDCAKEKEPSEAPQVLEEKQETEHENRVTYIVEKSLNAAKPQRKEYKLPKIRPNYTFKQSIENRHSGRAAYSSGIHDPCRAGGKCRRGGADSSQCE